MCLYVRTVCICVPYKHIYRHLSECNFHFLSFSLLVQKVVNLVHKHNIVSTEKEITKTFLVVNKGIEKYFLLDLPLAFFTLGA